jgi:transposase-like protein
MKAQRRRHDPSFKARVALEALKGIKTIQQIGKEFDVHPAQVTAWKATLQQGLGQVFERGAGGGGSDDFGRERAELHAKIGELTIAVGFLEKKCKQLGL